MHAKYGAIGQIGRSVPVPIRVGDALEVLQERVDVDAGQFLRRLGGVP